ncbi:LysM domain-containing protein [Mannheimia sp. AT1]|uniref:LysM domain-containing protein n=1 Tax=Mannheimia cairinae TaxID=3025936 RepID=A0ABT5MRG7_9PAST|nr:LysM domain-containing protein [Mannheimia cairinae]MDD0823462.1 LysM domain-containing protein [Mannheimia cairinae]MDD0826930.1 LysM domain-containing protein [Mannheimia cairinae]
MKKSLLVLSLASLALVGCSNTSGESSSSNVEMAEANATWQAADSIQTAPMPSTMNQPIATPPAYQTPAPQPISAVPAPVATNYGSQVENVGNCQVVRDGNNAPIYAQITKGCYTDSSYTVGKSDTLYLIGYLTGTSANHIATLNGLNTNAPLKVGQVLRVR